MVVGIMEITLRIHGVHSLKEKRSILKPLILKLRRNFNVSVAEIGEQDTWQTAKVAVACVSANSAQAHRLLEQVISHVSGEPTVDVTGTHLEIL